MKNKVGEILSILKYSMRGNQLSIRSIILTLLICTFFGSSPSEAEAQDTRIWILSVGIDKYPNFGSSANLDFAAKDARDVSNAFSNQIGNFYKDINRFVLINDKATLNNIHSSMRAIQMQMRAQDALIIYFVGHFSHNKNNEKFFNI